MDQFPKSFSILVALFCILFFSLTAVAGNKRFSVPPKTVRPVQYEVRDLSANVYSDNNILHILGKIKNTSFHPISGYIIVRFQDVANTELGYVETTLNQNRSIQHNELGNFEIIVDIKGESSISNVSVEFASFGK